MLPWLTYPMELHGSRDPGMCMLTPEQCAWKRRYWVFWYEADHVYALPTVALFMVAIGIFAVGHVLSALLPASVKANRRWLRMVSSTRFLSYKSLRLWGWNTPALGACLLGAVGAIFFLAMTLGPKPYYWPNTRELSYGNSPPIATRAGYMALACMPFLYVLGTKANFITAVTGISHEKLNLWHNWTAWAMFVLALVHTFPFVIYHQWLGDLVEVWNADGMWLTGVIALLAQAWLTFMSIRKIRDRYYEFFKATHIFFAVVFFIFFFLHCDWILTSWDYFIATAVLYTLSYLFALSRTVFEYGFRHRAQLNLDSDHNLQIAIETPLGSRWKPGQHFFLRFVTCGVHALTAHPFTVCSTPPLSQQEKGTMVFHVKPRRGLTKRLASLAEKQPGFNVTVLLDGPYGGLPMRWAEGFDRSVVVGGGAGAAFTLPLIEGFLQDRSSTGDVKSGARMTAIVASRDPLFHEWFLTALAKLATRYSIEDAVSGLSVLVHQTCEGEQNEAESSSNNGDDPEKNAQVRTKPADDDSTGHATVMKAFNVELHKGRPNLPVLARASFGEKDTSVGLVVCGPSSMVHDVSAVASEAQQAIVKGALAAKEVWFHKESFSY